MRASCRLGFLVCVCLVGLSGPAAAAAPATGDLWENTVQMTMEGMAMPPMTSKYCRPRNESWSEPPGAMQDDCEAVDWKMTGNTATWSIRCADGTTGTGEMTFEGQQAYHGTMTMHTSEGSMAMKLSGRRVGSECDPDAPRRQAEAFQRQAEAQQRQAKKMQAEAIADACKDAAQRFAVEMFQPPNGMCTSAEDAAALCANLRTEKGFDEVAGKPPYESPRLPNVVAFCRTETETVRQELCTAAVAKPSYAFLGRHCPAEAKPLLEANCAGRKFTSIPDPDVRAFCIAYASQSMSAQAEPEEPKKESKGKKFLKGLVGR